MPYPLNNGFAALADPTRRAIFELIAERPRAVVELAGEMPVSRPAVSQHLKVLKDAGLVSDVAEGNRRIYYVEPAGVAAVRDYLDRFWNSALVAFKVAAERPIERSSAVSATQTPESTVTTEILVEAPVERAFYVFTNDMGSWWPESHHILKAPLAHMVFEPRAGGSIYDVGTDGSECRWARVLAFEPPHRLVFSWDIALSWEIETDRSRTSEVEVRFVAEGPERTRVELEHRHIDRHGEGWEKMRDAVGSPDGWGIGLRRFAERAAATA